MTRPNCPTEEQEQRMVMQWAAMAEGKHPELRMLHHIPNGGARSARTGAMLKAQGVKKGVPDLCLPVPCGVYHGLYIELKRVIGGHVSAEQAEMLNALAAYGYKARICRGAEEAINTIRDYLREEERQ